MLTAEYLEERGRRSDPTLVDRVLGRVPDVRRIPATNYPSADAGRAGIQERLRLVE